MRGDLLRVPPRARCSRIVHGEESPSAIKAGLGVPRKSGPDKLIREARTTDLACGTQAAAPKPQRESGDVP